jgi:hypothetical protein
MAHPSPYIAGDGIGPEVASLKRQRVLQADGTAASAISSTLTGGSRSAASAIDRDRGAPYRGSTLELLSRGRCRPARRRSAARSGRHPAPRCGRRLACCVCVRRSERLCQHSARHGASGAAQCIDACKSGGSGRRRHDLRARTHRRHLLSAPRPGMPFQATDLCTYTVA